MATESRKTGFPEFFVDTKSAENLRRQFIEAPLAAAGQSALGSGIELANLLSILPAAFVASQERELKRVLSSEKKNDPRVDALKASIEQAGELQTMAQRGQVRIERALVAVADKNHVFHGFVSDPDLKPLKGLTVRLTGTQATRSNTLSTTTDDDGYFSIALGEKTKNPQDSGGRAGKRTFSQLISDLTSGQGIAPVPVPSSKSDTEDSSQVEILKGRTLLYSDPSLLAPGEGSIYREYVTADTSPSSASDLRTFVSEVSKAESRQVDTPTAAASSSEDTQRSHSTARPSTLRSSKKKSPRKASSNKPASKK